MVNTVAQGTRDCEKRSSRIIYNERFKDNK